MSDPLRAAMTEDTERLRRDARVGGRPGQPAGSTRRHPRSERPPPPEADRRGRLAGCPPSLYGRALPRPLLRPAQESDVARPRRGRPRRTHRERAPTRRQRARHAPRGADLRARRCERQTLQHGGRDRRIRRCDRPLPQDAHTSRRQRDREVLRDGLLPSKRREARRLAAQHLQEQVLPRLRNRGSAPRHRDLLRPPFPRSHAGPRGQRRRVDRQPRGDVRRQVAPHVGDRVPRRRGAPQRVHRRLEPARAEPPWNQEFFGASYFVGPNGRLPRIDSPEDLVVADLDIGELRRSDPSGWNLARDRRPDIYGR